MAIIFLKKVLKVIREFNKLNDAEKRECLRLILPNDCQPLINELEWPEASE